MDVNTLGAAKAKQRSRLRYLVAAAVCAGAVAYLLVGGLSRNIVYFRTVSEAVAERPGDTGRLRMAGEVVAGSVERTASGVAFQLTEGGVVASVLHQGDPPELFAAGVPVVCEGRWDGETFTSDRLMIRHGSEYRPPDVSPPSS